MLLSRLGMQFLLALGIFFSWILVQVGDSLFTSDSDKIRLYSYIFSGVAAILFFLLFFESLQKFTVPAAILLLSFPVIMFLVSMYSASWEHKSKVALRKDEAKNIMCILKILDLTESEKQFAYPKVRGISAYGSTKAIPELEEKFKIKFLPDCEYERHLGN